MKILNTYMPQNQIKSRQQVVPYRNYNLQQDTFTRTSSVSFRAGENIYAQILKNPEKVEQFIKLMVAETAFLISAAGIEDVVNTDENKSNEGNIFSRFLTRLFGQNKNETQDSELDKYIRENEKLKQENNELKAQLNKNSTETEKEIPANEQTEDNIFVFPKKRGRLSGNQQELKTTVESLNLQTEDTEKLTIICTELLKKNSHIINGQIKDNEQITKEFINELKSTENNSIKIKYVINKYLSLCELVQAEDNSAEQQTKDNGVDAKTKETNPIAGVKVVGRINLPSKKKVSKAPEIIIRDADGDIKSIYFKKAGTPTEYTALQLNEILQCFVKTIYNDYKDKEKINPKLEKPKWLFNVPLPKRVSKSDIEKEVRKKAKPDEQYVQIRKENFQEIADVINEDPRYNDLFDLHSALRFIDRYINFDSVDTGIDVQSKQLLDKLFDMLENAYKEGTYICVYKDKETGYIAPYIEIKSENFDDEAIRLFGSTDIVIGLSERQNAKIYKGVENNRKEAIISTVYPKDM